MFSPFLGVLGTWVSLMGMCQAGTLGVSNLAPLSVVYTVYPYYNSDSLLGILKTEGTLQVANDVDDFRRQPEVQKARNGADSGARDDTSGSDERASSRIDSQESAPVQNEATSEITYWPPVQRGAAPKLRLSRATGLRASNLKSGV